jgi:hypothetical protein
MILLYDLLKSPFGAHVHKTTFEPLIDTALYVMLLMRGKSITWASGRGLGPGKHDILGPPMSLT